MTSAYSRALFGLARERGVLDKTGRELAAFGRAVEAASTLGALWRRGNLSVRAKTDVLREALRAHISPLTLHFLLVLVRRRRESYLLAVTKRFAGLMRHERGRAGAQVFSAAALSPPLRAAVKELAERITGTGVDMEYAVDPALRGGFVLRVGDYMVDAGLRGRLERLRSALAAGSEVTGHGSQG